MWPFGKESEEDKRKRELQKATVQALERGEIPPLARKRLEERNTLGKGFFTSDLSTREYLLCRESGMETISQVMGSAFYKVGFRGYYTGRWGGTGELSNLSFAQSEARRIAISRMQQEAKLLGATGVVGVRLTARGYDWVSGVMEFTAIGTAVRVPGWTVTGEPFSSDLNGQEFWQIYKAGYRPKGIAFGVCSYYIYTDYNARRQMMNWWGGSTPNQEVDLYTQSFYQARHLAMRRFTESVRQLGGEGGVGMNVTYDMEEFEYEVNDVTYTDVLLNFTALGTAIAKQSQSTEQSRTGALICLDLSSGRKRLIGGNMLDDDL